MNLRWTPLIATGLLTIAAGPAGAQFQPPQQAEQSPCIQEFFKLRGETEQKGKAIQAAGARKAPPKEACGLFNAFLAAEAKMIKYAADNTVWCGIPPQILTQLKEGHAKASEIRARVCQAAAAPPRPAGPSLSDALNAPVTNSDNIKTGRGTFDTLTGTPLGK
jgi:hypothetical protein